MLAGYFMEDAHDDVQLLFAQLHRRPVFKDGIPHETIGTPNLMHFSPYQTLALHETLEITHLGSALVACPSEDRIQDSDAIFRFPRRLGSQIPVRPYRAIQPRA
jgi:hypothetical protein